MARSRIPPARAFTLIELLVVVAIIALLISILLPSLSRAREQAYQVKCAANMSAIFKGFFYYAQDKKNGRGFLPNIATYYRENGHWAAQVMPYVSLKRSKAGSKQGLYRCPADRDPVYVKLDGPNVGAPSTLLEKQQNDGGVGGGGGDPLANTGSGAGTKVGIHIEPISYNGMCDLARYSNAPRTDGRPLGMYSPRLDDIDKPYCYPLLAEAVGTGTFCFRLHGLRDPTTGAVRGDKGNRRHYGGEDNKTNGCNWMFADGHVQWQSVYTAATKMLCCIDTGREETGSDLGNDAVSLLRAEQRDLCSVSSPRP